MELCNHQSTFNVTKTQMHGCIVVDKAKSSTYIVMLELINIFVRKMHKT